MKLCDMWFDNACLGKKMLLVEVIPAYEYKDKQRTDTISGYRYVVCLVDHHLEKLNVRSMVLSCWSSPTASLKSTSKVWKCVLMRIRVL